MCYIWCYMTRLWYATHNVVLLRVSATPGTQADSKQAAQRKGMQESGTGQPTEALAGEWKAAGRPLAGH